MEQLIGYSDDSDIVKTNKKLSFIEKIEGVPKLIQYDLRLKEETSIQDIVSFYQFLYEMKLDSGLSNNFIFDLITEFNQLLTSNNDNLDFGRLLSIFNSEESSKTMVLQESMRKFMSLFELREKKELPIEDYIIMDRFSNHPNFIGKKESIDARNTVNSIDGNTQILKYYVFEMVPKSEKTKTEIVKQKMKSTTYATV